MELTRHETQVLILAISTALDKERHALEPLAGEVRRVDIVEAIDQRIKHVKDFDRLRAP